MARGEWEDRLDAMAAVFELHQPLEEIRRDMGHALAKLDSGERIRLGVALGILPGDPEQEGGFPSPRSVGEILAEPETEATWLAEGLIPAGGNLLVAAYPKTFKTFFVMALAVAGATGQPFLGRFETQRALRTGLILLEGGEREQARRLDRLAMGMGISGECLESLIYVWHRPPLRLNDPIAMLSLGRFAADLDLDLLVIDAWAYAAEGNSNEDWTVTPQLQAVSRLRDHRPGLSTLIVHHARKSGSDPEGERLTDIIRGSGAFGGWYDAALVLARKDEASPHVTVRTELREYPSPKSFAFTMEDEEPAQPSNDFIPQGALRLKASDLSPAALKLREKAEAMAADVLAFITDNPDCGKRQIRGGVTGKSEVKDAAVKLLQEQGRIEIDRGDTFEGMKIHAVEGAT